MTTENVGRSCGSWNLNDNVPTALVPDVMSAGRLQYRVAEFGGRD